MRNDENTQIFALVTVHAVILKVGRLRALYRLKNGFGLLKDLGGGCICITLISVFFRSQRRSGGVGFIVIHLGL